MTIRCGMVDDCYVEKFDVALLASEESAEDRLLPKPQNAYRNEL